jgi:YD repeat-containing protein
MDGCIGVFEVVKFHTKRHRANDACLLFDAAGRAITFEPLVVGQSQYSPSEDLWLLRGGVDAAWAHQPHWRHVPAALAANPEAVLAASGDGDVLWIFGPTPSAEAPPDPALSQHWRLIAQLDRFGRGQRYHHADGSGQQQDTPHGHLIGLADGVGRRYRLNYQRIHAGRPSAGLLQADDGWRLVAVELVSDPVGIGTLPLTLVRYGYSPQGDLLTVHDRAGVLVREFEVEHHRITAHRQRGGPWHSYRYASAQPGARVIEHSNQQGLGYRFEYLPQPPSPEGRPRALTRVSDSLGRVDSYHFEGEAGLQRLVRHERADGSQMRYEYDGAARLVASVDPLGRTTRLARDGQGRITGMQLPGGIKSSRQYDEASGRLVQSQDPTGAITHYRHDEYGRLIEVEQADGGTERYAYPSPQEAPLICDSPHQIEDAKGGTKRLAFSDAGLLVRYTDCSQSTTEYRHDRFGELIEVIDALGQRTVHERDGQGRISATRLPNGQIERYAYNAQGQLSHIEPAEGETGQHAIELAYDLWGRLTQRTHGGLRLQFEYDLAGRLTRLINENNSQSRFAWDVMDRLTQEEGFDQRLQTYRWDAAGQLIEARDGNAAGQRSTHYRWDEAGRLAQRELPATDAAPAQAHRYEWDAAARLMAASVHLLHTAGEQVQSRIELERDALGRITGELQRLYRPAQTLHAPAQIEYEHRITHRLDALGNRQSSQLQGLGHIDWLRYGSGHVHGLAHGGAALIDFERDALHRETRRSLHGQGADSLDIQRRWDALGRLHSLNTHNLNTQQLQGQAQTPQVLIGQISQRQYHYDALGQLSSVQTAQERMRPENPS